jgi:hypothetical protein
MYKKCCLPKEEAADREGLAEAEVMRAEPANAHRSELRETKAAILAKLAGVEVAEDELTTTRDSRLFAKLVDQLDPPAVLLLLACSVRVPLHPPSQTILKSPRLLPRLAAEVLRCITSCRRSTIEQASASPVGQEQELGLLA